MCRAWRLEDHRLSCFGQSEPTLAVHDPDRLEDADETDFEHRDVDYVDWGDTLHRGC